VTHVYLVVGVKIGKRDLPTHSQAWLVTQFWDEIVAEIIITPDFLQWKAKWRSFVSSCTRISPKKNKLKNVWRFPDLQIYINHGTKHFPSSRDASSQALLLSASKVLSFFRFSAMRYFCVSFHKLFFVSFNVVAMAICCTVMISRYRSFPEEFKLSSRKYKHKLCLQKKQTGLMFWSSTLKIFSVRVESILF